MKNNNLDEMQEQRLLRIEHNGFWLAFWGLLCTILVQLLVCGWRLEQIAGEWIVLMVIAVYMVADCARNGIWDRRLKPDGRSNLAVSLASGGAVAVFMFLTTLARYRAPLGSLAAGAFSGLMTFGLCLLALTLLARSVKKRQAELEAEPEEKDE